MGGYNGRGYYGRRHGGGFFFMPFLFIGVMLLFFSHAIFFFLPLLVMGVIAFAAFTFLRAMVFGHRGYGNGWGYSEKRKNYFMGDDGEMVDSYEGGAKRKRNDDHIDYV